MIIQDLATSGSLPTLELMMRFAGQRQAILAHNIANIDTPGFRHLDVSPRAFQATLRDAIDERRRQTGGEHGELRWSESRELARGRGGELTLVPRTPSAGVLYHDRNNRDLERLMQDLTENTAAFRVASDLMRSKVSSLRDALAERV
jgi:flagellar basal-body rod protein FlgB